MEFSAGTTSTLIDKAATAVVMKGRLFEIAGQAFYKIEKNGRSTFYVAVSQYK